MHLTCPAATGVPAGDFRAHLYPAHWTHPAVGIPGSPDWAGGAGCGCPLPRGPACLVHGQCD